MENSQASATKPQLILLPAASETIVTSTGKLPPP